MLLMREELRSLPLQQDKQELVGFLIDFRRVQIAALVIKSKKIISRQIVLPYSQIESVDDQGIKIITGASEATPERTFSDTQRYGELIGKKVFTVSNKYLGHIATYKLNSDSGDILTVWIKTPLHLRGLWKNTLLVDREQIAEIKPDRLIVEDSINKALLRSPSKPFNLDEEDLLDGVVPEAAKNSLQ